MAKYPPRAQFLPLMLSMLLSLCCSTCSQAQQQVPLKGSIQQYALASKPIDPLLWPGNKFDKEAARSLLRNQDQESSIWHRIPAWQAGNWQGDQAINLRAIKYINGAPVDYPPIGVHTAAGKFTKGLLKDKKGEIWHCFQSDYWSETDHGDQQVESYILYSAPGGGEFPDFYAESVDFNVDKASKQIVSLRRAKAWTRYTNLRPGLLKEETLRSNFDVQGNPTATSFNTALEKRIEPFSAYEAGFAAKKALLDDFHNYLRLHGMADLIPATSSKAASQKEKQ